PIATPPCSAAVTPYTTELFTWASMLEGLTTRPQSSAQTTRCTLRLRFDRSTEISITCATSPKYELTTARPRNLPPGGGVPQPACSAAVPRPRRCRGAFLSKSRRSPQVSTL